MPGRALLAALCAAAAVSCTDRPEPVAPNSTDVAFSTQAVSGEGYVAFYTQRFTRKGGVPDVQRSPVLELGSRVGVVHLVISTGAPNGKNRVGATTVLVNGRVAMRPEDFAAPAHRWVVPVRIDSSSVRVEVNLVGQPNAYIEVTLERPGAPVGAGGGRLELHGGDVAVEVPQGALETPAALTADPVTPELLEAAGISSEGVLLAFDFGPDGQRFEKAITISLPVPSNVPASIDPEKLVLAWLDNRGVWQQLQNTRVVDGRVTGDIDHFTIIGIVPGVVRVCPGEASAVASLATAVNMVASGGTVLLCRTNHVASGILINKSLTIVADPSDLRSNRPVVVSDVPTEVTFRISADTASVISLASFNLAGHTSYAILGGRDYRSITVEDVDFLNAASSGGSMQVGASSRPDAWVLVRRTVSQGGFAGVFAAGAPTMDVVDSRFSWQVASSIQFQNGSSGSILRNEITGCGGSGCIRARGAGTLNISDNVIRSARAAGAAPSMPRVAILAGGQAVQVTGNDIAGVGAYDAANPATYPYDFGIAVEAFGAPAVGVVNGNRVSDAARGVSVYGSASGAAHAAGVDNVFSRVHTAVTSGGGGTMTLRRNDFTSFVAPVAVLSPVEGVPMPFGTGDLTCNWWGAAGTPAGMDPAVPTGAYTPTATQPIAGQSGVSCDPTPITLYPATLVCSASDGSIPTYATLRAAVNATADNGTVSLCAGDHTIDSLTITRPMVISGAGAAATTIRSSVDNRILQVQHPSGTVAIRNLKFAGATGYALFAYSTAATMLLEDLEFALTSGQGPYIANAVPGSRVTVRNIRVVGGGSGLFAPGAAMVDILDSHFENQGGVNVQFQNGTNGTIRGNTITGCGANGCIRIPSSGEVTIADNAISSPMRGGNLRWGIVAAGTSLRIENNIITGIGSILDAADTTQYVFKTSGIQIWTGGGTSAVVSGNRITNAVHGILSVGDGGTSGVIVQGQDNVVTTVRTAVASSNGGAASLQRNDFSNFVLAASLSTPPPGSDPLGAGSLACNWWGRAEGASALDNVELSAVSPHSPEPIAGRPGVTCAP
jgi:hypothetical protein